MSDTIALVEYAKALSERGLLRRQRDELLEALQDLTAQIAADENADCLHLLPQTKVFDAALTAIAKATGEGT